MPGCERKKLTSWKEDKFTVRPMRGIKEREKRMKEILNKEIPKAKPGNWARRRFAPVSYTHLTLPTIYSV